MNELELLAQQLAAAIAAGDTNAALQILAQIAALTPEGGADQDYAGAYDDLAQVHNLANCPVSPHGDQVVQKSWIPRPVSLAGNAGVLPRYWQFTFDFSPSGHDYDFWFNSVDGLYKEYRFWFKDIVTVRGPVMTPPVGDDPAGSFGEAVQQRYEVEYRYAYWKRRMPPTSRYFPGESFANGINGAWFMWYGGIPNGGVPSPITEPYAVDSIADEGWLCGFIENTRTKASSGGNSFANTYSPLLLYMLQPPEEGFPRSTVFRSNSRNVFEPYFYGIGFPEHYMIVEPFYP